MTTEALSGNWISVPVQNTAGEFVSFRPMRYDLFVLKLFKVTDHEKMVGHAGRGIASEAGEINDCLKKAIDYEQDLNMANLIEEIGDMRFYLQCLQNLYGISDQVILQANATKLSERYRNLEYSDEQAKLRRDKESK